MYGEHCLTVPRVDILRVSISEYRVSIDPFDTTGNAPHYRGLCLQRNIHRRAVGQVARAKHPNILQGQMELVGYAAMSTGCIVVDKDTELYITYVGE